MTKILKDLKLKSVNYIFFLLLSLFALIGECGHALINKTVSSQENPSVMMKEPVILNNSMARRFEFVPHSNTEQKGKTAQAVPPQPPTPPEQPPIPPKPIPPDQANIQQSQPPQPPIPPIASPNSTQQAQQPQTSQPASLPSGVPPVPAYQKRILQNSSAPPPPPVATFPSPSLPAASQQGFIPSFTNMLAQLAKVVVLLLALGGAIFAYKKFKQGSVSVIPPKIEKSAFEKKQKPTKSQKPQKEPKKPFLLSSLVTLLPFKKGKSDKTFKNENNTPQVTKTEPETVSQAVSSFVRHKIRR